MIVRLLIVDDDISLSQHLKTFFERQKYKVETAQDGPSAVAKASEFRPHLMFLDIGLPGVSGIEVLKEIKRNDPSVRVIMITGQTEDELIRQAKILGADDYVTKPFTLEYLSGEVMDKLHKQLFHELRTASQDLAIEREKVELLFEQVKEGVILFDVKGVIFSANPVARATFDLPEDIHSVSAKNIFEKFEYQPPDRLAQLENETGDPFDLSRSSPRQFVLECRINSIFSPKKERFGYLALFRDVTYERKADNAMHHFISLISHKLRTPLVTIRAYPRLLLSENAVSPLNKFQKNAIETIQKQCRLMEDMVNQLIAFSSLDPDRLYCQDVVCSDLVTEALRLMPDDLRDRIPQVKAESELSRYFVHVDPTLMQHAARNVIENAFKFGASELNVTGKLDNDFVVLQFKDNGPGIPPEDRDRIFDRFYQIEKTFCGQVPGAGLGLTLVKQTVEAHGGKTWVESEIGKGTTLCIQLPTAASNNGHAH